ncbi:MAG: carboxypeptidase-like regulatory domain-containing protein, partial [Chitinophagaceae bacterium]|nr:carboxypeptidase-like regulatory domain-containing protein [Chitinophagaceae bacterium]
MHLIAIGRFLLCLRTSVTKTCLPARQALLVMKLTIILLTVTMLEAGATGFSQSVSISERNARLESVFKKIEKQTGYYFWYENKTIRDAKKISVELRNASLQEALNKCLANLPLDYLIVEKTIVIKAKGFSSTETSEKLQVGELQLFEIRGRVTNEKGEPMAGATVHIASLNRSVATDANGYFTIEAPNGEVALTISYIGYTSQSIAVGNRSYIDVRMALDESATAEEVVVTALGRTREKRALGYAVQQVNSDQLVISKSVDPSGSLVGKIAGLQVTGAPSSTFDNNTVIIRGINGLAPGNPLYVLDGTPTDQANIIMDNIESISVLKGAAATALYGNRASNGVILVTSKKGARNAAPVVELNLGTAIENVYLLPPFQNEYAGGNKSSVSEPGTAYDDEGFVRFTYKPGVHPESWAQFDGQRLIEYGTGNAWGPKINGQDYRPYYSWYPGDDFGKLGKLTAYPNNARDFFRTGRNLNNSISISGGGDQFRYRITYANQNRTLTLPGSDRNQNQVGINASYDVSKKLTITTDLAYTGNKTVGNPYRAGNLNITHQLVNYFQRQVDMSRLENYRNPDGTINTWNIGDPNASGNPAIYLAPQTWVNPYFIARENYSTEKTNRLIGNLGFDYKFNDVFNLTSYVRLDQKQGVLDNRTATGGLMVPGYELRQYIIQEVNYEVNLNFRKKINDFS